jgi:hypothetical protein
MFNKQEARDDTKALGPCKLTPTTSSKRQLQLYWGLSLSYKPMRNNASNNINIQMRLTFPSIAIWSYISSNGAYYNNNNIAFCPKQVGDK